MPKKAKPLGPLEVSRLRAPGLHPVGTVAGLRLNVMPSGARSWVLRAQIGDRRREIGLGGYPDVTLAQAHDAARQARGLILKGIDPVEERRAAQSALRAQQAKDITFQEAASKYIAKHRAGWGNPKHVQQWTNSLEAYANPVIGSLLVRHIEMAHVLEILEPIWESKTETARRVRGRIESVLDFAKGKGWRSGDNPASWKGNLDAQLPEPSKVMTIRPHPAMKLTEIGEFMTRLRSAEGQGARALELVILTAARSGEVRGMTWGEIDMDAGMWTVPAERMKAGKEHRVPLAPAAIKVLEKQPRIADCDFVFIGAKGRPLSDMTLTAIMRRMGLTAVPHGFRSTFRDWSSERTNYPSEMAEMALAHTIDNKVEAAYRRGDLFEKRRRMMSDWAKFIGTVAPAAGKVIALREAA